MVLETAILLLIAAAFCAIACVLYNCALPMELAEDTWTVIRGVGSGDGLEQQVRSLMWLRSWGLLRCRVILTDGGLDAQGRELAHNLARRWPELELWNDLNL